MSAYRVTPSRPARRSIVSRLARHPARIAVLLAAAVAASAAVQAPAVAAPDRPWSPPRPGSAAGLKVAPVATTVRPTWLPAGREARGEPKVTWPAPGAETIDLTAGAAPRAAAGGPAALSRVNAGKLPVSVAAVPPAPGADVLRAAGAAARPVGKVGVRILDRAKTASAGVQGVMLAVHRADGAGTAGRVELSLDYTGFAAAYGGDWASRLRLVRLPDCALTTPAAKECATRTPVETVNDANTGTLRAQVSLAASGAGTVLAAAAAPAGQNGDYKATSLSPSSTWQVSQQTGDFGWSYPVRVPPAVGGPEPKLTLAYSSGSVDGRTGGTNTQGSWIGDGWEMWPGYIERQYKSCPDDKDEVDEKAPNNKKDVYGGDQCWFSDNATMSLNGRATELVKDGNVWRGVSDDGSRIERVTDPDKSLGDHRHQYWKVTTIDGTQYYFGRNKRAGWSAGKELTNSAWSTQVYGNHPGEPGHKEKFADSREEQTWRWNLDYVVDPHRNTMSYFYEKETGAYGREGDEDKRTTYTRGGWLQRIEYGTRYDSEYTVKPAARVWFDAADRCTPGAECTPDKPSSWRDTPWDQYCDKAPCKDKFSPTFWTQKRLAKIRTEVYSGSGDAYQPVEELTLRHEWLNAGVNGTEGVPMWLRGLTRTGKVTTAGGAAVSDPEIIFSPGADPLPNRVDGPFDNRSKLNRWRIQIITTETGAQITPKYSETQCTRSALPKPATNTQRCYPQYYAPEGQDPTLDWFHKYRVERVDVHDQTGASTSMQTNYHYLDDPAWHYDDSELVKPKKRTWGEFRGYGKVQVREGDSKGVQTVTEYRYFRGMDGDKQDSGVRNVTVEDSQGGKVEDHEAYHGMTREERKLIGDVAVSGTINDPWKRGPLATDGPLKSWMANTRTVRGYTRLENDRLRWTRSTTTFNDDGLPTEVDDRGDEATAADDTCTRTEYARNDDPEVWLLDKVKRTESVGVDCTKPVRPADLLTEEKTYYDNPALKHGIPPTKGDVVLTEELREVDGSTRLYDVTARTSYDDNGRSVDSYDALDRRTRTEYTPATAGPVKQTVVLNPLQHKVTTTFAPGWHLPVKTIDANEKATNLTYDGLGRLEKVWLAGRATNTLPDMRFSYQVRNNAPTAVTTRKLLPDRRLATDPHFKLDPDYKVSVTLYDGWMRERQVQTQSPVQGRVLTDTLYDSRGLKASASAPYYDTTNAAVGTTLVAGPGQPVVPATTEYLHDGAGRQIAEILKDQGAEKWRTTTTYGGDRTHVTPPLGGTATTTVTNARDKTVELRQYQDRTQVGSDDATKYDTTGYTYTKRGELASVVDPAGNTWKYGYDLRGRKVHDEDPDKGTSTLGYDAAGQQTSVLDSRKVALFTTYDPLGRKIAVRENSVTGPLRASWTYDSLKNGKGKPVASTRYDAAGNAFVSEVTGYDAAGRASGTRITIADTPLSRGVAGSWTYGTTYKIDGQTSTSTLPAMGGLSGETLVHNYNSIGAPTTMVSGETSYVRSATYNEVGTLTQRVLGAVGKQISLTYDVDKVTGRLKTTTASREGNSDALKLGYDYDHTGNLIKLSDTTHGLTADTQCFEYDHLRRMTEAWTPGSGDCRAARTEEALGGAASYWHSYTYDVTGSRKTETRHLPGVDTERVYGYPAAKGPQPHTLTQVTTTDAEGSSVERYAYNETGDTRQRVIGGDTQTLAWDADGNLASVTKGSLTSQYLYDADGNRLIAKDSTGTTLYLPGGAELHAPTNGGPANATRYYSHLDVSVAVRTVTGLRFNVTDHHNTSEVQVDPATLAMDRRRTLPFGELRVPAGTWVGDKGFVNGTVDDTGLTHIGAREYDPALGRFISVDPVIDHNDPQQLHGYAYSNNAPATFTDPDGLLFGSLWNKAKSTVSSAAAKAGDAVADAASSATKATVNFVKDTVNDIKKDPLKFATEVAVGIAVAAAVGAVCATGVGCVILAGAAAGAAAAGAAYGVDVAQGEKEFSPKQLATEMAVGGVAGAAGGALGVGASKVGSKLLGRARKCHSFAPDTPVLMADGSAREIGAVQLGDRVLATDPLTGGSAEQEVVARFQHRDELLTTLTVRDGAGATDTVLTTQNHEFWDETAQDWVEAGKLVPGHRLRSADGATVTVVLVDNQVGDHDMRDLRVAGLHTYYVFVGGATVLVHNCDLADRAKQIHEAEPNGRAREATTVAVVRAQTPHGKVDVVAGSGDGLTKAQRAVPLRQGEMHADNIPGAHAEVNAFLFINRMGWRPLAGGTSRNICRMFCLPWIRASGGQLWGPLYRSNNLSKTTRQRSFRWF